MGEPQWARSRTRRADRADLQENPDARQEADGRVLLGGTELAKVQSFKYLGRIFTRNDFALQLRVGQV